MRYSTSLYGLRGLSGVVRDGDEVTFRFRPRGVTAAMGRQIAEYLDVVCRMLGFAEADYAGWGSGANEGLIVIKTERDSDLDRELQEFADAMVGIAATAGQRANAVVEFLDAATEDEVALPRLAVLEDAEERAAEAARAAAAAANMTQEEVARSAASGGGGTRERESGMGWLLPLLLVVGGGTAVYYFWWRKR